MSLLATQRRFLDALLEPLSGENRGLAELPPGPATPSDAFHATADELLHSTPEVHARERLGLYHRQYWFRLIDSLGEDFPRVRTLLGPAAYLATIERHLAARPPSCWTLRHLGAGFADHLRADPGIAAPLQPWAAALATYDYAHMEVFEAAVLPAPDPADFNAAHLILQPAVRLVLVDRPISRLLHTDSPPAPADLTARPRRELHVVWRTPGHALRARREPLSVLPLLLALRAGGTLADLLARARPLPSPETIQPFFTRCRDLGWLGRAA